MNLVSPLDRVSVTNPMDSKWSTTAWRSLGWERKMEQNELEKDKTNQSTVYGNSRPLHQNYSKEESYLLLSL